MDCFSKYSIVHACRDATTAILCKVLEEKIFLTHGAPRIIICDNGSQFRSKMFAELCEKYRVTIWFTPVYHAQANPSEAVNKIIGNSIRCYIRDSGEQQYWDKNISQVAIAINTSIHSATSATPFEIIFGRAFALTGQHNALSQPISDTQNTSVQENVRKMQKQVSEHLKKAYEKAKNRYDMRTRVVTYAVGEPVYRRNFQLSNKAAGYSAKLAPRYIRGIIVEKLGNNVFKVRDNSGRAAGNYHTKDMKKILL